MQHKRVIVCGAGLAGLAAAHELARARVDVTVVEARDRLGGRTWTVRDGFAGGQHAELGGEFIDAEHQYMRALAAQFHLDLVPVLTRGFTHRFTPRGRGIEVSRTGPWDSLREVLGPLIDQYAAVEGDVTAKPVEHIAERSLRQWLDDRGAGPELYAMARALRGFFLADPEELSILQPVELLADGQIPSRVRMFRIAGGVDRLVTALVRGTNARLMLRHDVKRIAQGPAGVVAHVVDGAGRLQELEADALIVTFPASVLRDVDVVPPLPAEQRHAIAAVRYGRATKLAVQTTCRALRDRQAQAFATDTALGAFWDATDGQPSRTHSMINFLAGGAASPDLQRRAVANAASVLRELCWLGLAGAEVTALRAATWEEDPYARGGYAFLDPGFRPAWRPLLSRPAGRLFFAGEHTSDDFQGYMEGAARSGMRAAAEVLDTTKRPDP